MFLLRFLPVMIETNANNQYSGLASRNKPISPGARSKRAECRQLLVPLVLLRRAESGLAMSTPSLESTLVRLIVFAIGIHDDRLNHRWWNFLG
jgi:hypothetical protein